jgi:hypothetical protein
LVFNQIWFGLKEEVVIKRHVLFDAVRGATKRLISNATDAETTNTDVISF